MGQHKDSGVLVIHTMSLMGFQTVERPLYTSHTCHAIHAHAHAHNLLIGATITLFYFVDAVISIRRVVRLLYRYYMEYMLDKYIVSLVK